VAVEDWLAREVRLSDGAPGWHRLLARYPSVASQFADARPIREFTWMPRVSYRAEVASGERWAMLPSAAAFVDPLFSTGIPLTLLGIERLARDLEDGPRAATRGVKAGQYGDVTLSEADRTARFIAGSYAGFGRFSQFAAYSMFYFASASFSEMARRLASPRTPRGFLCGDSPGFVSALDRLSPARGGADREGYDRQVAAAVAERNIAGLCDPGKQNWYGVDSSDTIRGAGKLGLAPEQVREALALNGSSVPSAPSVPG
jgi:FADH2 O2-dependent halogenase